MTELGLVGWEPDIWVPGLLLQGTARQAALKGGAGTCL